MQNLNGIPLPLRVLAAVAFGLMPAISPAAEATEPPHSPDGSVTVSLFAEAPQIVTPIGAAVDTKGRLMVIESNTHFRQKNYQGPATDRIRIFDDTPGAAKAGRIITFYEGGPYLMNLVGLRDGSVLVSSRNEIFRLADRGGKDAALEKTTLARLDTAADYPHNGLNGLAVSSDGHVYFGIGENLGGAWTLSGTDGKKLSDEKGSGAVFRVDPQGRDLTLVARGFWNPFGLGFDAMGNTWAVDNDPDGRPPSRLIHVLPGADYGFEFRYGRTGMHPLQAWDGELPGTLGMVAGVGEAPVAVVWQRDCLFVSSWRDHQVQIYNLTPRGASYTASAGILLAGGENFRPTGLAFGPDGSLYVNDWASSSYAVNGKGRIWKVTFSQPAPPETNDKPTEAMQRAARLRESQDTAELIAALDDPDPATAQAAQYGLSRLPATEKIEWNSLTTPRQRIGLLAALLWRGTDVQSDIAPALKDENDQVRQMAVRAVAEQNLTGSRDALKDLLDSQVLSPRLLGMTVATLNQLDGDKSARIDSGKIDGVLLARMNLPQATDAAKATALHMLQHSHPRIAIDRLEMWAQSPETALQLEAVRYLAGDTDAGRFAILAKVAGDEKADPAVRAEAIDGLADDAAAHSDLLLQGAHDADKAVREESLRSIRPAVASLTPAQKDQLAQVAKQNPAQADLVRRAMGVPLEARPPETNIAAWQKILDQAPGDPDAGRRIFFHPAGPACFRCHTLEGRGKSIGPDLTMIGHSQTREHVLESILDPSKEIAPLFTLWSIKTRSGQQIDAMLLRRDGSAKEIYVDASGQETVIPESQIVERRIGKESLMPAGLVQALTDQELRDLVALLVQKR
jgi:putative membrane-bound dehydrogenase-like protein